MRRHWNITLPAHCAELGGMCSGHASVAFVVMGNCASLKNSRRLFRNRRTGQAQFARSKSATTFMDAFVLQVPLKYRNLKLGSLTAPLRLLATVFYQSRRSDLDISAVMDGLQAAGVIANDRFIIEQHLFAEVDKDNPRVEITIEEL